MSLVQANNSPTKSLFSFSPPKLRINGRKEIAITITPPILLHFHTPLIAKHRCLSTYVSVYSVCFDGFVIYCLVNIVLFSNSGSVSEPEPLARFLFSFFVSFFKGDFFFKFIFENPLFFSYWGRNDIFFLCYLEKRIKKRNY